MSAGIAGCCLLTQEVLNRLNHLGLLVTLEVDKVIKRYNIRGVTSLAPTMDEASMSPSKAPAKMFITGARSLMNVRFSGPNMELLQEFFGISCCTMMFIWCRGCFTALSIDVSQHDVDQFVQAVERLC